MGELTRTRILLLEDRPEDAELMLRELKRANMEFDSIRVETREAFLEQLENSPNLILADYSLPQFDGLHALELTRAMDPNLPFLLVSGTMGEEVAVECMRLGATDYLLKDRLSRLGPAVKHALEQARIRHERREYQDALAREQQLLSRIIATTPVGLIQLSKSAEVLFANPRALEILGMDKSPDGGALQLPSTFVFTHFDGSPLDSSEAPVERIMESGEAFADLRVALDHPDGRVLLSASGAPMVDEAGNVESVIFAFEDVTERVQAEKAIEESERRFRSLVQNASDMITVISRENTVLYLSPSVQPILGYTPDVLMGEDLTAYIHLLDLPEFEAKQASALARPGGMLQATLRFRHHDGSWRFLECTGTNLIEDAVVGGIVINSRDVTERHRHIKENQAIVSISSALRKAETSSEMPPIILDQLMSLTNSGAAALGLIDPATGETEIVLGAGEWRSATGTRVEPGRGISASVIAEGHAYINNDLPNSVDPRLTHPELMVKFKCIGSVPLIAHGDPMGVLWIGRDQPILEDEANLMTAVADMTANALRRASLHEETQKRMNQMAVVSQLGHEFGESLDRRVVFESLLEAVAQVFDQIDTVVAVTYDPKDDMLHFGAGVQQGEKVAPNSPSPVSLKTVLDGVHAQTIESRSPVIMNDFQSERVAMQAPLLFVPESPETRSVLLVPMLARGEVIGAVQVRSQKAGRFSQDDVELLSLVANTAAVAVQNSTLIDELQTRNVDLGLAYDTTLEGWAKALELRDQGTEGHTRRVADMTLKLAAAMGVSGDAFVHLRRGALLHDIGKMGIPDSILLKPGRLEDDEWEIMRMHPEYAVDMLSPIPFLEPALEIPHYHHEKWDGSGYPEGLKGEDIPLAARIFAVVDVWDALTSDRPYRKAWPAEKARNQIAEQSGHHFDPQVAHAFLKLLDEGLIQDRRKAA